jgi:hypothetical protein
MDPFLVVMTWVIGILYVVMAILGPFIGHFRKTQPRAAVFAGFLLLLVGGIAGFGSALSAWGGLGWLPESFEWPIGSSVGAITMPGGEHVVPHIFAARVQIYDRNLKFVRGWAVPSYGKDFKVRPAGRDRFDALYGTRTDTYLLDGKLVGHKSGGPSYYTLPDYGQRLSIPTWPWLLIFSGSWPPFLSGALGMAVLALLKRREEQAKATDEPYRTV